MGYGMVVPWSVYLFWEVVQANHLLSINFWVHLTLVTLSISPSPKLAEGLESQSPSSKMGEGVGG